MDNRRTPRSQLLFELSCTTSCFHRITIPASKSGIKIITMFPYWILRSTSCCLYKIDNKHKSIP
jgi:hypothetical protein